MIVRVPDLLTATELDTLRKALHETPFVDGSGTAGWSAREVKHNLQVEAGSERHLPLATIVRDAFMRHATLQMALLPAALTQPMFNRYDVGMTYGPHVDSPVMGGPGKSLRSDVAVTVFLTDPADYEGGELTVEFGGLRHRFKLAAGAALAYPANTLHHVTPVTRGSRRAAIFWVQSQVRDVARRELLWDLETARRQVFEQVGKSSAFDTLTKAHANLLRMWVDV